MNAHELVKNEHWESQGVFVFFAGLGRFWKVEISYCPLAILLCYISCHNDKSEIKLCYAEL